MSQLDISIFYSHLLGLLLVLYVFSHFAIIIISNYFYNLKVREIDTEEQAHSSQEYSKINLLNKILE